MLSLGDNLTRCALLALLTTACSGVGQERPRAATTQIDLGPGVSASLAKWRAEAISDLRYEIFLSIPEERNQPITGTLTARFDLGALDQPLAFDFAQAPSHVRSVSSRGEPIELELRDEHILLRAPALSRGRNEIRIEFVAGDGSLNRADEFLYTLFVPDRARVALPIFDQPDLKARFDLTLEIPADWQAVANGGLESRTVEEGRATLSFRPSHPISTYLFAFAAGRFKILTAERGGRELRMFHRETDADKVERNLEAIFDLHATALEWLEDYTAIPYPFEKLDFVAMPAFQYGGMEHAGAIFYRDRGLFLDETATQNQVLGRASLIAHEVAHMWFGNLVTMEWFNDVWMKEVFANFMAAKIVNPSFPEIDHELRFLLAHYPPAYRVDRTAGANPIRQELDNLAGAGSLYGAIIYQKAPVVMKHLERLMGAETFRDGLREYLDGHLYGNATWPDLIAVLDRRTEEALPEWSQVWVNEAGRPTIEVELELAGGFRSDGESATTIDSLYLRQQDPAGRDRLWSQRLEVLFGYPGETRSMPVYLRSPLARVEQATGLEAPAFILANGAGVGYGHFVLDDRSRGYLLEHLPTIREARVRAIAWLSLWDAMLTGAVAPRDLIELALTAIPQEDDELNLQSILGYLGGAYWRYLPSPARRGLAPRVETLLWEELQAAERTTLRAAYFSAYRDLALGDGAVARLKQIWSGALEIEGLTLSENDTTALAEALAVRGVADAEALLEEQRERITNPDSRIRFDFVRPALSADAATRDAFFASLANSANRERERWVLEALRFLHHPLRAAESEAYILPSLELLEEIQRTGDIFFPLGWLGATLGGHNSDRAAETVRRFLDQHTELPPRLRGKLLQAADPLFRAARLIEN